MFKIITDSGSDIREEQAKELGIDIAHLKISFQDEVLIQYQESDVDHFYKKLEESKKLPVTSQPSPQDFLDLYNRYLDEEILVLTLSSGLSGTLNSSELAKVMAHDPDRITIVDTKQVTLSQNVVVAEAVRMRDAGRGISEVAAVCRELADRTTIVGLIDTLEYLRKGGRIPKSMAAIGTIMNMKPVVEMRDGVLSTVGKARGHKAGLRILAEQVAALGIDADYKVFIGTSGSTKFLPEIEELIKTEYPQVEYEISKIGGVIGTHIGPDSVGVGFVKRNY